MTRLNVVGDTGTIDRCVTQKLEDGHRGGSEADQEIDPYASDHETAPELPRTVFALIPSPQL